MKKRRQHYVWKKYLKPWSGNGKIWCRRRGDVPFHTNPINVAVERDFYQLDKLTKNDLTFIFKIAVEQINNETLRNLNVGWITEFESIFRLESELKTRDSLSKAAVDTLEEVMHNLDENHHTLVENIAENYLESLVRGDVSFYEDDDAAIEFSYFLASQYFRTKKVRDKIFSLFTNIIIDDVSIKRAWPIMRHIFSTSMGCMLYAKKEEYPLILLNNDSNIDCITSDQPVQNIYALDIPDGQIVNEVELYYPVSPRRAVIISNKPKYKGKSEEFVGLEDISYFNDVVVKSSYKQVIAKTEDCLNESRFSYSLEPEEHKNLVDLIVNR